MTIQTMYLAPPLVGPATLDDLTDAYDWVVPDGIRRRKVGVQDAYRNCAAIGAIRVEAPDKDSHYKVWFRHAERPWTFSANDDPVPQQYLRELRPLTGYSLDVIIFALLNGRLPERRARLWRYEAPRDPD